MRTRDGDGFWLGLTLLARIVAGGPAGIAALAHGFWLLAIGVGVLAALGCLFRKFGDGIDWLARHFPRLARPTPWGPVGFWLALTVLVSVPSVVHLVRLHLR
jgi:hypothetical protein